MTQHPSSALDPEAKSAIADLTFTGQPLVIVDVDEVVVHMIKPLIPWLAAKDLVLDIDSYKLGGNIKDAKTGATIPKEDVGGLIQAFFDDQIHTQEVVDHVAGVLDRLSRVCQVILFTNAPHRHRQTRRASLLAQGVTATLVTNDGPKGPPVAMIRDRAIEAGAPEAIVFIDDSAQNLESVRLHVPGAELIHFIAHAQFRALSRDVAGVALKTGDWLKVEQHIISWMQRR